MHGETLKLVPDVLKDCGGKQSKKNSYWPAWPH